MIRSLTSILLRATLWLACSWLLYHSVQFTFSANTEGIEIYKALFLQGTISNAIIYFSMLYFFPRNEVRWSPTFLYQAVILYFAVTGPELLIDYRVLSLLEIPIEFQLRWELGLTTVVGNLIVLALGLSSGLILDWFHQHRLAREVRQQQVQTELDLLKSRINPHFLFNVLNGIFYTAQKNGDEETADAIARLSDMMRYMLHEVSETRVPLEGELAYLENYVTMQRMRLSETIPVHFTIEGNPSSFTVPPMLLLPFVENAFKYGVSNARPTPITIRIEIQPGSLKLEVENQIHPRADRESGGFGLENAQRRLELLYPGKHQLEAAAHGDHYRVNLLLEAENPTAEAVAVPTPILKERDA